LEKLMLKIEQIRETLLSHQPQPVASGAKRQAAVAMLLVDSAAGPEVLFIRRAEYDGDPWSGDVAFPGGGIETEDASPRHAAEREAWEEIGLQLQPQQYLGQLDELSGAYLPIQIYCFVYLLEEKPEFATNGEVVDTFWVPLSELLSTQRRTEASFTYRGQKRTHPIIDLDGYCEQFLWGITYRLFENFFTLLGCRSHPTSKNA
jgi:8-oxo-dGTP pyrophosphatase MutT (NUDIX family)